MSRKVTDKIGGKKKIVIVVIVVVLLLVLSFFGYHFISNKIEDIKAKKFYSSIREFSKERIYYVFVEINPSFALAIKNNRVNDFACLNEDCVSIYRDIDIKGMNINESIDNLYNISKDNGFDISNGIKVKTSDNINIESKDYITIEYIDTVKEKELINMVRNNEEFKNITNSKYYSNLWEKLQKDSDYGDVFTCYMNDSKELECHIKDDFVIVEDDLLEILKNGNMVDVIFNYPKVIPRLEKIEFVLKKFNFNVRTRVTDLFTSPAEIINVRGNEFSYVTGGTAKDVYYTGRIRCGFYKFYLTELNLLNPDSIPLINDDEDDFDYNNTEDHYYTKTVIDEDNQIEEIFNRYCNEVMCHKEVRRVESQCKLQEDGAYNWESNETITCQECELGYKNCIYVSCEKYHIR